MEENKMDTITLFEEYRLIERSESEVNGAWKGAHLLLFFLAFVFGSFCTFCFHMLMYLFDEKCVLFPKLLSLTSLRQNIIYEFMPEEKEIADMLPVDFLSTQWVDKSACYLPTYVPLLSGIFGLVWTTMFLMCSTGSRNLTGLQRPWRVLLPVFIFSLAMGGLCLYATIVTQNGLQELCVKLGEITGTSTCTYTVNVATLAYERRIRGVYQATRITILSAWLHTLCWLMSALLTVARVILVVDFQLIKVSVQLRGNIDRMLERHERQIRTVSPDLWFDELSPRLSSRSQSSVKVHFQKKDLKSRLVDTSSLEVNYLNDPYREYGEILFKSSIPPATSNPSLVEAERNKLARIKAYNAVPKDKQFIVKIVYDLIDPINLPDTSVISYLSPSMEATMSKTKPLVRQYGQQNLPNAKQKISEFVIDSRISEELSLKLKQNSDKKIKGRLLELQSDASTSKKYLEFESVMNITPEMKQIIEDNLLEKSVEKTPKRVLSASNIELKTVEAQEQSKSKKSSLKHKNTQTDEPAKNVPTHKVQITESKVSIVTNVIFESSTDQEWLSDKKKTDPLKKEKKD